MNLRHQSPLWRRMVRLAGRWLFHRAENNDDPRFAQNGEGWLLRELLAAHARGTPGRAFVAFDGGANAGDYTREILAAARHGHCSVEVHAFEPSPHCLEGLRRLFVSEPAVRLAMGKLVLPELRHAVWEIRR